MSPKLVHSYSISHRIEEAYNKKKKSNEPLKLVTSRFSPVPFLFPPSFAISFDEESYFAPVPVHTYHYPNYVQRYKRGFGFLFVEISMVTLETTNSGIEVGCIKLAGETRPVFPTLEFLSLQKRVSFCLVRRY